MHISVLYSKIHRATVTDADLHYEGSITIDAALMEQAVYALPEKHREAVRWWYVYRRNPAAMARSLGVSKQGLADLVGDGRTMLQNRLCK